MQKGLGKGYREGNPNNFQYYGQASGTPRWLISPRAPNSAIRTRPPHTLLTGNGNVYYGTTALCPGCQQYAAACCRVSACLLVLACLVVAGVGVVKAPLLFFFQHYLVSKRGAGPLVV